MEIPVLVWSLKSSIWSSTSFPMGKTFWGVLSAAVEQSRGKASMVAQGDGKFGSRGWPQDPSKAKKNIPRKFKSQIGAVASNSYKTPSLLIQGLNCYLHQLQTVLSFCLIQSHYFLAGCEFPESRKQWQHKCDSQKKEGKNQRLKWMNELSRALIVTRWFECISPRYLKTALGFISNLKLSDFDYWYLSGLLYLYYITYCTAYLKPSTEWTS